MIYLGFADLLSDIGSPGAFDGPEVDTALATLIDVTSRYGLVAGSGGAPKPSLQLRAIRAGVRFIMSSSDLGLIRSGAGQALKSILDGLEEAERDATLVDAGKSS